VRGCYLGLGGLRRAWLRRAAKRRGLDSDIDGENAAAAGCFLPLAMTEGWKSSPRDIWNDNRFGNDALCKPALFNSARWRLLWFGSWLR